MEIKADASRHTIIVDGQHYCVEESEDGKTHTMIKIDINEYDKKIREVASKLIDAVDKNMLITDVLVSMTKKDMYDLHDKLFKTKRPRKPKMQPGCVEMTVGDITIPIRT